MVISQSDIDAYAHFSHDHNPLHVDQEAASKGPFGKTIAHGTIACAILQDLYYRLAGGHREFIPLVGNFKFLSPLFPEEPAVYEIAIPDRSKADCQVRTGDRLILVGDIREIETDGL
jgi:acyl dehydratase